jgi:DNA repair exonuclease SbcCD ATPase subunit
MTETAAPAPSAPANATDTSAPAQEQANTDTPQPEAAPPPREKRRIVARELSDDDEFVLDVDGEERVVSAKEWRRNTQRSESADKRYRDAAERVRIAEEKERAAIAQAEALREDLRDPRRFREALRQLGYNPSEIAQRLAEVEREEAQLTPEQRKIREYERILAAQQEQQRQWQQQQQERQLEARVQQIESRFHVVMDKAGVPKDAKRMRAAVLDHMSVFADHVQQTEGRIPSVGETIAEIHSFKGEFGGAPAKPLEERVKEITPEMWDAYQRAQARLKPSTIAEAPRTAPPSQAQRDRDPRTGQFVSPTQELGTGGRRVVTDIMSVFDRR